MVYFADIQLDPEKLKQADFACFNGLRMLLWDRSLDVWFFDN